MRRWILARVAAGSYLHCRVDFKKDKADVTRTRFETTFSEHMPNKDLWARGHLHSFIHELLDGGEVLTGIAVARLR